MEHAADFEEPSNGSTDGVVTAYDVGVSAIRRLLDELDELEQCDVLVVAAGREGALATVVAGLVDVPVIGLPVGTGSGLGGDGEAALLGMLQSCTSLTTVNVDAGFVGRTDRAGHGELTALCFDEAQPLRMCRSYTWIDDRGENTGRFQRPSIPRGARRQRR